MKKKLCTIILSTIIVCSLLSGCSDKHTAIIMENAKAFSLTQEISESLKQEDYGIQSYTFLKYIQEYLPGRIAGSEKREGNGFVYICYFVKWWIFRKRNRIKVF